MKKTILLVLTTCVSTIATAQTLHYDRPADFFEEALVIGNGTMGGTVYGGTRVDRISLNDITLWTGEPCNMRVQTPDAHKAIPDIREALRQGDYQQADKLQRKVQGHYTQNYQPLGQLQIEYLDTLGRQSDYRRWLDIGNATAHTEWKRDGHDYSVTYFATHPDSGLVVHIKTNNPQGLHARISLTSPLRYEVQAKGQLLQADGYAAYSSLPSYVKRGEEHFSYDPERGIHFRTAIQVKADRSATADDAYQGKTVWADSAALVISGSREATLYVVCATSFNGYDKDPVREGRPYKAIADERLSHLSSTSYADLLSRHVADYQNIYNRVQLLLGKKTTVSDAAAVSDASATVSDASAAVSDASPSEAPRPTDVQLREYLDENTFNPQLEALYFQYGRYLLISCSRTPNVPANLQGLWNEKMLPPWSCNYTANINLEENYWAAETAALPEMHQSLLSFMKELQGSGELTAKAYYGVQRGWCLAHNTDIWAMTCPVGMQSGDPSWANWNMGGAWVSTHIWEHYAFSLDRDFLREYYPVLRGAAEFCMNWLVSTRDMGISGREYLITAPATSPENIYVNDEGYHGRTCYGGFADLAMTRECLADALQAARVLGIDSDFQRQAQQTLARLQPYKIGKKGNLQEWFYDWEDQDPHHRHQSHLFGIYPGHQAIAAVNRPEDILRAASRTLELKGDQTTGWSTGWRVNLYARLHDAKNAYHIYRKLLSYVSPDGYKGPNARRGGGTYPNLLDAHSPFQIDGNFGGCAGVIEMLMQSRYSIDRKGRPTLAIELLPALPDNWRDGSVKGIRARGALTVDMTWAEGKVTTLTIETQQPCRVSLTVNGKQKTVRLKQGCNQISITE